MAFSYTWDVAFDGLPADNEFARLGAGRIRDLKGALVERLKIDHVWENGSEDGKHLQVTFEASTVDPPLPATGSILYSRDQLGRPELFFENALGDRVQLTEHNAILGASVFFGGALTLLLDTLGRPTVNFAANTYITFDGTKFIFVANSVVVGQFPP